MPEDLFYPVGVVTCIMVFEANKPNAGRKTWFGYFKDDGFEKRKHLGRIDAKNRYTEIKNHWLYSYRNEEQIPGLSVRHEVSAEDEWCAEAYMETDYSTLSEVDFVKKMRNYAAYLVQYGSDEYWKSIWQGSSNVTSPFNTQNPSLSDRTWKDFRYDQIFDIKHGFYNKKPEDNPNGDIPFIGAHFAGWSIWEEATEKLAGAPNLYVDLSSSLYALSSEKALELIHAYGADRVLWGTDYPMWESKSEMEYFNKIDLTEKERSQILWENAYKLLGLD
jgi:hypothetical protein